MEGEGVPYIKHLKQRVTIRLDKALVTFFKTMATELGTPYPTHIHLDLRDGAVNQRKVLIKRAPGW